MPRPESAIVPPPGAGGDPVPWHVRLPGAAVVIHAVPASPDEHTELLHGWLHQPHVRRWWSHGDLPTTARYIAGQRASGHLVPWVVAADGRPFGYVETYRAADDPLAEAYPLTAADRGWHVLVGPPDAIGSGLPRLLGRAVVAHLLTRPGVERVVCEPDERNARMIAFCRALGHERLATIDLPDKRAALLACTRASFAARWPGDSEAAAAATAGGPRALDGAGDLSPTGGPSALDGATDANSARTPGPGASVGGPGEVSPAGGPGEANPADEPADTNPASGPGDTNPADEPADTNPASGPADTNPADEPADTNPASGPADTNPASGPADTNPADGPGDVGEAAVTPGLGGPAGGPGEVSPGAADETSA